MRRDVVGAIVQQKNGGTVMGKREKELVGARRFELLTPASRTRCVTTPDQISLLLSTATYPCCCYIGNLLQGKKVTPPSRFFSCQKHAQCHISLLPHYVIHV